MLKCNTIFVFIFVFSMFTIEAQTGLFGNKNAVEFSYALAPSIKRKKVLTSQNSVADKLRIVNQSFDFDYKRIINNRLSVVVGISYANIHSIGSRIINEATNESITYYNEYLGKLITDQFLISYYWDFIEPKFTYNAISIGIDYYSSNSINPVGVYWGTDIEIGRIDASFNNVLVYRSSVSGGPLPNVNDNSIKEISLDRYSRKYSTVLVRGYVSKKIIISHNLMLNLKISGNLLSAIVGNNIRTSSFNFDTIWSANNQLYLTENNEQRTLINNAYASLQAYKRFDLGVGLSYYF